MTMNGPNDAPTENDIRELRTLLKSAQNDVKRYAAHVIRLQQELDRERLKNQPPRVNEVPVDSYDDQVEELAYDTEVMRKALERLQREMKAECAVCHCQQAHGRAAEEEEETIPSQLQRVQDLLALQSEQLVSLARDNVKLRDALDKRPSHRDLARSQWQIEGLQSQIARLKEERRTQPTIAEPPPATPIYDTPATDTLADRISVDKLLSWLHVETKKVKRTGPHAKQSRFMRRRFLKDPVECYLVLDSAALESSPSRLSSSTMTENDKMKKREQISRRVGMLCSEIVASCCHSVGVYEIAKLPQYVEATYQYAQLVPLLQDFVDRVDGLTQAAALTTSEKPVNNDKKQNHATSDQGFLDNLTARVQDLVFEVRARRDQMKPPGDAALSVVLRCMKLLRAEHIDQLSGTIEKLIDSTRCEKDFLRDVRKLLGVDVAAPRADVLTLIRQLMDQVGLSPSSKQSKTATTTRARTRRAA